MSVFEVQHHILLILPPVLYEHLLLCLNQFCVIGQLGVKPGPSTEPTRPDIFLVLWVFLVSCFGFAGRNGV